VNGYKYFGYYSDDKEHGVGTKIFPTGERYEGEFY